MDYLLKAYGSTLLIPLVVAGALPFLAKGLFTFHRSRSQDRKDFLDLWVKRDPTDDLWLQVSVRHVYGEYLPAAVLRHLIAQPQGGRALSEISYAWPLLEWDDDLKCLHWREPKHCSMVRRRREIWCSLSTYFFSAVLSGIAIWFILAGHVEGGWVQWTYAVAGVMVASHCLTRYERLKSANSDVPRWLSTLSWKNGSCNLPAVDQNEKSGRRKRKVRR